MGNLQWTIGNKESLKANPLFLLCSVRQLFTAQQGKFYVHLKEKQDTLQCVLFYNLRYD